MASPRKSLHAISVGFALSLGALVSLPLLAQDTAVVDPDGNEIVVEGQLPDGGVAARQQARNITHRLGSTSEPLARFQRPICAGVWGMTEENAALVISRIYDNARRIELEIDETEGCAANVWAIFVDDPAATFAELREDNGWMVRDLSFSERNVVEDQEGPARAWNVTTTRTAEGQVVATGFETVAANMLSQQNPDAGGAPIAPTSNMSRLESAVRRDIELSVVLIDRSALADLDAFAIADYATMRLLARTLEPSRDTPYGTIMTLFSEDSGVDRMTAFDVAYLRALYRGDAHRQGTRALTNLDSLMAQEVMRAQ